MRLSAKDWEFLDKREGNLIRQLLKILLYEK